jgi:NAD(P) transhydrogenase subunit alpha
MPLTLAVLKERAQGEARVALSPETAKLFVAAGFAVRLETGAGEAAGLPDALYVEAGATIASTPEAALAGASLVLAVQRPDASWREQIPSGCALVGMLDPHAHASDAAWYASQNIAAFAMERIPRISRAQSMDTLSSQSNLAGYRAVIEAVSAMGKAVPLLMTSAGTVAPARFVILGAGVAGLQAIATARRLGGIIAAFDVRPAVKEQVESLGASFIEVPADPNESAETSGGYAKEMSESYQNRQRQAIHDAVAKADVVISTALIPGREAPELLTDAMLADMKAGAVIVDMAAASGGNYRGTQRGEVIRVGGVMVIGYDNLPSRVAFDASRLYAKNLYNFVALLHAKDADTLTLDSDDEIVKATRWGG